jgi:hypothetical protein
MFGSPLASIEYIRAGRLRHLRLPPNHLNKKINAVLADPKIKAQISDLGALPLPMTSADFGKLISADTEKACGDHRRRRPERARSLLPPLVDGRPTGTTGASHPGKFPDLWRARRETGQSLSREIGSRR